MSEETKYEIDYKKLIGQGAFASVYLSRRKGEKDYNYVAKEIRKKSKFMGVVEREIKNAETMKDKQHPNVLYIKDVEKTKESVIVYSKYYKGKTLEDYMDAKAILPINEVKDFFTEILQGLDFLHSKGIVHRDMKNENVFLEIKEDDKYRAVIGDLGFARDIQDSMDTIIGTPITMSPELFEYEVYSNNVDIWALGSMLYKMCFGKYPFEEGNLKKNIKEGKYKLKDNILATVNSLKIIAKCLSKNPAKRPTTEQLLKEDLVTKPLEELELVWIKKDITLSITNGIVQLEESLKKEENFYIINPRTKHEY